MDSLILKDVMNRIFVVALAAFLAATCLQASEIMPSFAGAPAGWSVDRYAPAGFSDIGNYQGQSNVLGITIDSSGNLANRPAPYRSTFYNTQGEGYAVSGGVGDMISAALYIPSDWSDSSVSGDVRTDLWGVMSNGAATPLYPVIGFTNYGGARYRVYDDPGNAWIDLPIPVLYDQWTQFGIALTSNSVVYTINGMDVATLTDMGSATGFSAVTIQAYNFADPSLANTNPQSYTAYWSSSAPEPGPAVLVLGGALLMFAGKFRRRR
jgi:hypothetical protein